MENKRKALGRGLEQLFSNEAIDLEGFEKSIIESARKEDVVEVNLSELRSNPYQPRKKFDEEKLKELAESIKEYGIIEPIIIKKSIKGYEIVAGERRVKASRLAGRETILAIIKDFTDQEMMEIALLENVQREDLSAIEEAEAYRKMIISLGLTQDELATKIGKSRSHVTNILGLLRLPKNIQELLMDGSISMAHARVLSKLEDTDKINNLAQLIVHDGLNVRKLEEIVTNPDYKKKVAIKKRIIKLNQYSHIEEIMREKIGTMVKIGEKNITIPYDSEKDLERILEILKIDINVE